MWFLDGESTLGQTFGVREVEEVGKESLSLCLVFWTVPMEVLQSEYSGWLSMPLRRPTQCPCYERGRQLMSTRLVLHLVNVMLPAGFWVLTGLFKRSDIREQNTRIYYTLAKISRKKEGDVFPCGILILQGRYKSISKHHHKATCSHKIAQLAPSGHDLQTNHGVNSLHKVFVQDRTNLRI